MQLLKFFNAKNRKRFAYAIIMIAPIVIIGFKSDIMDHKKAICLSMVLFKIECYACHLITAIIHLLHLEFNTAWEINKLSFIVVPVFIPLWIRSFYEVFDKELPNFLKKIF